MSGLQVKKMPKPRKGSRTEPQCTVRLEREKESAEEAQKEREVRSGAPWGTRSSGSPEKVPQREGVKDCASCCWQVGEVNLDSSWTEKTGRQEGTGADSDTASRGGWFNSFFYTKGAKKFGGSWWRSGLRKRYF